MALQRVREFISSPRNGPAGVAETGAVVLQLLQGQLRGLTPADLDAAQRTSDRSKPLFAAKLAEIAHLGQGLARARVPAADFRNVSDETKAFLRAWNDNLMSTAKLMRDVRVVFAKFAPVFEWRTELLSAARRALRSGDTTNFEAVRLRILGRLGPLITATSNPNRSTSVADTKLVETINHRPDALTLVKAVNKRYPHGDLARRVKTK
jgi:hypothetical protein